MAPAALEFQDVWFRYAGGSEDVLQGASLSIAQGAFALLVGNTGSGKSTLLRLCQHELTPAGTLKGSIRIAGRPVEEVDASDSARTVGLVFQNPANQIVCESVWHEMAFGLENLGMPQEQMRLRVAETCTYLGIASWFRRTTADLSGGQQQVLALAATLAMRPQVLLLDEPTSMLDPVAQGQFLSLLFRANRELGITVVVATHSPHTMAVYATMALRIEDGTVSPLALEDVAATPALVGLSRDVHMSWADGMREAQAVRVRDAWLRYAREDDWVLRGCGLSLSQGEARALLGGNGCGKTTLLGTIARTMRPQRGRVANTLATCQALLPQDPKALLSFETVEAELMEWASPKGYDREQAEELLEQLHLPQSVLGMHPYDLSGGQQQLVALGKLLLARPRLLLLDEPTKGLDQQVRAVVARTLVDVRNRGTTMIIATHDLAFVEAVCDTATLLFDGEATCTLPCDEFFAATTFLRP